VRKIVQFFQKLFSFSYAEARGFVNLFIVCLAALMLIFISKFLMHNPTPVDLEDARKLDSLVRILENTGLSHEKSELFSFDPNILPTDSLILLGIDKKVATIIGNYRKKGGRFHSREDLKKIYGLSDQTYNALSEFIDLPDSISISKNKSINFSIDINQANAAQLKEIQMVGDVLSARIVKYREALGGFIEKEQIEEVYGLSDVALLNLKSSIIIKSGFRPRAIKINYDSLEVLKNHPYISDQLAEDIIRFRTINSIIESEKVLTNFKSIDKSNFQKLIFYLDFQ